ncbi:MAG TPA: serine hydrolase domain-containing protein [Gemmatales bacterium]|nr:serine hydrolase domain-containing protein [Gemmatales bacterium]
MIPNRWLMKYFRHALLFLLLHISVQHVQAQAEQKDLASLLQARMDSLVKQSTLPGGVSAALVMPDGSLLTFQAGYADREANRKMSADTLLMQGSVGKTYVAAIALQLVFEKKLNLNEKASHYLGQEPWFEQLPNAKDVTIRMLMNHTSGIMRYELDPKFTSDLTKEPTRKWKPVERLTYVFGKKPRFEAGQGWDYSDTNYIVLGMIIEKITGRSIEDLIKSQLLDPLGLKQTMSTNRLAIPGLAQGYAGPQNPFGGKALMLNQDGSMIVNPQFEWTGGGMASTPADLARWAKLMYEGKAFDASMLPVMLEGVKAPMLGREAQYGLGVILRPTPLGKTYGHSGFFPGYMTEVMYWPEKKLAVAVQVNTSEFQKVKPRLTQWCVELGSVVFPVK